VTDLIPANLSIPAHLANRVGKPSALSTSITGGIGGTTDYGPRISIKGSRFRIISEGNETVLPTLELEVVIVGANPKLSKAFYSKKWDPNDEPEGPTCYSLDGDRPHPDVEEKQNDLCASCRHNAWGSKVTDTGQKLKACTDSKRLAVVPANNPTGPVYLLSVTPAALKGLNHFQKELQMRGIAPEIVKTKIGFDPQASFPKLTFGFGGFLDEATQTEVDKLFGTPDVLKVTGEMQVASTPKSDPKPLLVKEVAPVVETPKVETMTPEEAAVGDDLANGFGFGGKTAPEPKVSAPKETKVKEEVKPKVVGNDQGVDLADEIANMLAGMSPDDDA